MQNRSIDMTLGKWLKWHKLPSLDWSKWYRQPCPRMAQVTSGHQTGIESPGMGLGVALGQRFLPCILFQTCMGQAQAGSLRDLRYASNPEPLASLAKLRQGSLSHATIRPPKTIETSRIATFQGESPMAGLRHPGIPAIPRKPVLVRWLLIGLRNLVFSKKLLRVFKILKGRIWKAPQSENGSPWWVEYRKWHNIKITGPSNEDNICNNFNVTLHNDNCFL